MQMQAALHHDESAVSVALGYANAVSIASQWKGHQHGVRLCTCSKHCITMKCRQRGVRLCQCSKHCITMKCRQRGARLCPCSKHCIIMKMPSGGGFSHRHRRKWYEQCREHCIISQHCMIGYENANSVALLIKSMTATKVRNRMLHVNTANKVGSWGWEGCLKWKFKKKMSTIWK